MNQEEQVPQARTAAAAADAETTPAEKLEGWGVPARDILLRIARAGQLLDVRCEMPQCYCPRGRGYFEKRSPGAKWQPTAEYLLPLCKQEVAGSSPAGSMAARPLVERR